MDMRSLLSDLDRTSEVFGILLRMDVEGVLPAGRRNVLHQLDILLHSKMTKAIDSPA